MKRFIFAIVACAMIFITLGSSAEASTYGAEHAVEREISFDYGNIAGPYGVSVDCSKYGRNRYGCSIGFLDPSSNNGYGPTEYIKGRARVTQVGKRYYVNYRIYW